MDRRLFLKGIPLWSAALNLERAPVLAATFGTPPPEVILRGRNLLPTSVPPEVVAWFWAEKPEFQTEGYRQFIDFIAEHTNFGMIATSLRAPQREITDPATQLKIKRAVEYAHRRGLKVAMDLDVRLARERLSPTLSRPATVDAADPARFHLRRVAPPRRLSHLSP